MRFAAFVNRSNLLLALSAACMHAYAFLILGCYVDIFQMIAVFFLTWCGYLFLKSASSAVHRSLYYIAATGAIFFTQYTGRIFILSACAAGFIVLMYQLNWTSALNIQCTWKGLRHQSVSKLMSIAAGWCLVGTVPAVLTCQSPALKQQILLLGSEISLILGLALVSDLRDMNLDRGHITTLPNQISRAIASALCLGLFVVSAICQGALMSKLPALAVSICLLIILPATLLIYCKSITSRRHLHTLCIDGFLCLRFTVPFVYLF